VNDILLKVLSKEPAARYRTADQLGRVLQSVVDHPNGGTVRTAPEAERTRPEAVRTQQVPPADRRPPPPRMPPAKPETRAPAPVQAPEPRPGIDWRNVFLALLAIVAVGGLVPFWIWVYFSLYGAP
jgi:serine/threonine-protein kinase